MPAPDGNRPDPDEAGTLAAMATLRMFASAREAAGTGRGRVRGCDGGRCAGRGYVASFGEGFATGAAIVQSVGQR